MYTYIEEEYKKSNWLYKFRNLYWTYAIFISITVCLLPISWILQILLGLVCAVIFISIYLLIIMKKTLKENNYRKKKDENPWTTFINIKNNDLINSLIECLRKSNITRKEDIKLLINHYENDNNKKNKPNIADIYISIVLSIPTFVELAYNSQTKSINISTIITLFVTAAVIMLVLWIFFKIVSFIINNIMIKKEIIKSKLSEDLAYIYYHFNNYKNQLSKKRS